MKYIKKPVEVEAFRWRADKEPRWFEDALNFGIIQHHTFDNGSPEELFILKKENELNVAYSGDYIVKNQNGEIYPIKENKFLNTYEKVEE